MNAATPTREIYWNVSNVWVMYALLMPAAAVAGYGLYRHIRRWRRRLPDLRARVSRRGLAHRGDERPVGGLVAFRRPGRARLKPAHDRRADARGPPVGVVVSPLDRVRLRRVGALHEDDARLHSAAQHLRGQPRPARRVAQTR